MCDTFAVRRPGGVLFAKSSDRPIDEPQIARWFVPRRAGGTIDATWTTVPDEGAAALLGSQPTWMWGLEHGVNEHGVAIGNEKVFTIDDPHAAPSALLGMDLVRLGLERGRTADGALDAITSLLAVHGQGGSGEEDHDEPYWSSFLIVDGHGGWVLETSARSWVAQPLGDGAAISNRLTLSTHWTRSSTDVAAGSDWDSWRAPDAPTGIADHRLRSTRSCVALGPAATPADAVATLRDHGTGPWGAPGAASTSAPPPPDDVHDDWSGVTVCMHIRDYQCTTASMVIDLPSNDAAPMRTWVSLGTPCTGVFLPVAVRFAEGAMRASATVPEVVGDAEAWRTFAALGRRVEARGEEGASALAAIRDVLDPLEASTWAQADELHELDAGPEAWRAATDGWDAALRDALAALHHPT